MGRVGFLPRQEAHQSFRGVLGDAIDGEANAKARLLPFWYPSFDSGYRRAHGRKIPPTITTERFFKRRTNRISLSGHNPS
jgi:hypothetical protein